VERAHVIPFGAFPRHPTTGELLLTMRHSDNAVTCSDAARRADFGAYRTQSPQKPAAGRLGKGADQSVPCNISLDSMLTEIRKSHDPSDCRARRMLAMSQLSSHPGAGTHAPTHTLP
jgi:hypothetical protein